MGMTGVLIELMVDYPGAQSRVQVNADGRMKHDVVHNLPRALLFDMDGTLTEPVIDFAALKAEMGIGRRPILEAMASGRPVITPTHGPALEFVPEAAGLRVPSVNAEVDVTALARALRFLYENRDAGTKMGHAGREASLAYSWDRIAEKYAAEAENPGNRRALAALDMAPFVLRSGLVAG